MYRLYVSIDLSNEFIANSSLKVDHVHLKVTNLHEAVEFYQSVLGFTVLRIDSGRNLAYLGLAESTSDKSSALLVLDQVNGDNNVYSTTRDRREAGLYHLAILLPERKYLASFLRHIQENLDPRFYEGMADHAVSESTYLHDPD
jgi:catechol 2,3-dioxygenase